METQKLSATLVIGRRHPHPVLWSRREREPWHIVQAIYRRAKAYVEANIMNWFLGVLVCGLFLLPGVTFAETIQVPYPIQKLSGAEQPSVDLIKIHLGVLYPNGCFAPSLSAGRLRDANTVELVHYAQMFDTDCTQRLEHAGSTLEMARPDDGTYTIVDVVDDRVLGTLEMTSGLATLIPKEDL